MTDFYPRLSQQEILKYTSGHLGISAVPGAGKTHTLSRLAANLILNGNLLPDQELLIVTLVNSAVDNFSSRIAKFIKDEGLIPNLGYRVRTLHGLAHDIVREKPARVGLEERFQIIDEQEAARIRLDAVHAWLVSNPGALDHFIDPTLDESKVKWVHRQHLPGMLESLVLAFIRSAKDHRLTPEGLASLAKDGQGQNLLFTMGLAIYTDYQRALRYRGAVDFDDLIRLSLDLLNSDPEFLVRLRYRFPYILEDEAQDSSELQEQMLGLLSGEGGNWVRVGDPNQAIFETFTTASPEFLRRFIGANPHVDMDESGRSQPSIIGLANHLVEWTMTSHPNPDARSALAPPFIRPTSPDDPQSNPANDPAGIHLHHRKYTPEVEIEAVMKSLKHWLPEHPEATVAVLVPRNTRGVEVITALAKNEIETVEFLSSTSNTRAAAGALSHILAFLADPGSAAKLSKTYQVWRRDWRNESQFLPLYKQVSGLLRKCEKVEAFIAPVAGGDWLDSISIPPPEDGFDARNELEQFRLLARRWLEAVTLPIDQLVLTLAVDLFTEPDDLALSHKIALLLRQVADEHADWRLAELTAELVVIAKNERRFIGFSSDDTGFDPDRYRGKVVVMTMHKAKGLEWDRVYLMSVNNYDFPSDQPNDTFISERWFLRDHLNLEAEALAQLEYMLVSGEYSAYHEGAATHSARLDYVRERLRLLYVGITRARKELIITWNTGRQGKSTPALGLAALQGWWEGLHPAAQPPAKTG